VSHEGLADVAAALVAKGAAGVTFLQLLSQKYRIKNKLIKGNIIQRECLMRINRAQGWYLIDRVIILRMYWRGLL
jgi:hypothetical protein